MAELKTLKDFDTVFIKSEWSNCLSRIIQQHDEDLRQEAIKWIKDLLEGTSFEPIPMPKKEFVNCDEPTDIAVNCFKCFFNITDEELK